MDIWGFHMIFTKPRVRPTPAGFSCIGLGKAGIGRTIRAAYFDWLNECGFYPYA